MRLGLVLVLSCALGCSENKPRAARETYDYLVTPSGERFRVIGAGPIVRGANTRLGLRITYVSEAQEPSDLKKQADTLLAALGPEMLLSGDTMLVIRARLGSVTLELDPGGRRAYDLEYRRVGGGFELRQPDRLPKIPNLSGVKVADDATFPFRQEHLDEAAAAGKEWLTWLDGGDLERTRAAMTAHFRKQVSDDAKYGELLERRQQAGLPGVRRELYRQQERSKTPGRTPGSDAMLVFESGPADGPRVVERVVMARYSDAWLVSGYAFQPIPN